ncbi:hypothetical protein PA598K_03572 [Paenibacillus sp. 598K]|uniref:nucleotidyltransferase family protein n=1 Tax=Paenibacillus sp. 598K TaxID=1117987 RepID=UPI000FFA02F4|nr:nucleotidyltransferase family protein [Paenibacillus sp. 598K]GBF75186.1 hypothetical protein PA598K_03572 [Paenibacillus sp. 598K]
MSRPLIALAILAAGQSSRMGLPKQLLPIDGEPMLGHIVRKAAAAGSWLGDCPGQPISAGQQSQHAEWCRQTLASSVAQARVAEQHTAACLLQVEVGVIGPDDLRLQRLCDDRKAQYIVNTTPSLGMSSSIHVAVRWAQRTGAGALMILLGDQPGVQTHVLKAMLLRYVAARPAILQARYSDRSGHPVLFDSRWFPELLQLQGDRGASALLRQKRQLVQYVDVPALSPVDLDTQEEYEAYLSLMQTDSV